MCKRERGEKERLRKIEQVKVCMFFLCVWVSEKEGERKGEREKGERERGGRGLNACFVHNRLFIKKCVLLLLLPFFRLKTSWRWWERLLLQISLWQSLHFSPLLLTDHNNRCCCCCCCCCCYWSNIKKLFCLLVLSSDHSVFDESGCLEKISNHWLRLCVTYTYWGKHWYTFSFV